MGIAVVIFLCISLTVPDPNANLQGKQSISMLPYDDALVYAVEADGSCEYLVCDLNAYRALKKYAPEMSWSDEKRCYLCEAEPMETVQILSEQEGDTLHVRLTDEAALVYLTFEVATGESFSIDDGENVQTYTFSESGYYYIRLHDNCTVRLKDGTAKVAYQEVLRDYEPLIPADYDSEEQLHFNLYLWEEYILSAE